MKAVVYEDVRRVGIHDVQDATLEDPTDVVVRLSSSALTRKAWKVLIRVTHGRGRAD